MEADFNPYVGPRPFQDEPADRARFFGRDLETLEIVSLVAANPVTLVYAQSGAGKTSLFNAKILPALRARGFETLPMTRVLGGIPSGVDADDLDNVYAFNALLKLAPTLEPHGLLRARLDAYLEQLPRATGGRGKRAPRALVLDQFEELFAFGGRNPEGERRAFFDQLTQAIGADSLLRIVLVIREDHVAKLDPYANLLPGRLRARFRLERLRREAALAAIAGPLTGTGHAFEQGVAEQLVNELLKQRTVGVDGETIDATGLYVEPVQLQVVCQSLWDHLPPGTTLIGSEHLERFGDVDSALRRFYEDALAATLATTGIDEAALRRFFGRTLITPMLTRGTEFRGPDATGGLPNEAIDALQNRHILRADVRAGVAWYELTHDRFIEPIVSSNEAWMVRHGGGARNPLAAPTELWRRLGGDSALLTGKLLDDAQEWALDHADEVQADEAEYLRASVDYRRKRHRRVALTRTLVTLGAVLLSAAAVAAAWLAFIQRDSAVQARAQAEAARDQAEAARDQATEARQLAEAAALESRLAFDELNTLASKALDLAADGDVRAATELLQVALADASQAIRDALGTVILARADWSTGYFQAAVYRQLLQELGYDVADPATLELSPSVAYRAMAQGDVDLWANSWYPIHYVWWDEALPDGSTVGDHLTVVGQELPGGGLQGFIATKSFADEHGITTLDDLNADPEALAAFDAFDAVPGNGVADIYGCQENWTCDDIITNQIAFSGWDNISQIVGDYGGMMAEATDKANRGEPIVAYTWTPSEYIIELEPGRNVIWLGVERVLDDSNPAGLPRGESHDQRPGTANVGERECPAAKDADACLTGWISADIQVTANTEFLAAEPAAAELLALVTFSPIDVAIAVKEEADGRDADEVAAEWVANNRATADAWLAQAAAAADS